MIIFYNKATGKIVGMFEGRIHSPAHLNMWIGSKEKNDRIIVSWKKTDAGEYIPDVEESQQSIYKEIDKKPTSVYNYAVDLENKKLKNNI